jgi:hypothetical protein
VLLASSDTRQIVPPRLLKPSERVTYQVRLEIQHASHFEPL